MDQWITERLSKCLDFPVPSDMVDYILTLSNADTAEDYFTTLLDFQKPEHRTFFNDFKIRQFNNNKNPGVFDNNSTTTAANGGGGHKKKIVLTTASRKVEKNDKYISKSQRDENQGATSTATKKKNKYVSLYQDGQMVADAVLIKGRHRCNCQAIKHKLVNNCLKCGRIICEQEGSGPCLFCGALVCSEEQQRVIDSATKKGDNLKKSLMEQNRPKGWEEAMAQRNRLLEYDRASEKRTTVIDDESDYFKANSVWLTDEERQKMKQMEAAVQDQKHGSRLNRKITIDFAGRQIVDDNEDKNKFEDEILSQISKMASKKNFSAKTAKQQLLQLSDSVHPGLEFPPPVFDESLWPKQVKPKGNDKTACFDGVYSRIQDKELMDLSDMRNCLSMHQPWASLLVAGIKKHEGRSWYSAHRGRLWIASTAKAADPLMVKAMEEFYRKHYHDAEIAFPSQYPTASLLGCVSMSDCLDQEEYQERFPDGESDSPYVFICTDAQELPIRLPISGMHKIYKLDAGIHTAAVKALQRMAKLKAEHDEGVH